MSPDLTEIINTAEKAVGLNPEAKPAAEGAEGAPNGEVDGDDDDEDEVEEGAAAGSGEHTPTNHPGTVRFRVLTRLCPAPQRRRRVSSPFSVGDRLGGQPRAASSSASFKATQRLTAP